LCSESFITTPFRKKEPGCKLNRNGAKVIKFPWIPKRRADTLAVIRKGGEPCECARQRGSLPLLHVITMGLVTAILWFLLSGVTAPFILSLGAFSVAAVVLIARRMDVIDHEGHPIHLTWRATGYWLWLVVEIFKSNWEVARAVLMPRTYIRPVIVNLTASQRSEIGQVIYANSITLTPGTVALDSEPGHLIVHALMESGAQSLLDGEMDQRVSQVESAKASMDPPR
jgi:multicomponent Na+:H+ antiporter subunit E